MAQQLLYPSQIHDDNLEKKGNYDLCLLWVSLNKKTLHIVSPPNIINVIYIYVYYATLLAKHILY